MTTRALAQTYEPNPLLAYVYRRFFEHIQVDETWVATVREAAARGSVVYILRNLSFLDFLALDHLTKRHGLPRIRFANDLGLWVLEPMGKGWLQRAHPADPRRRRRGADAGHRARRLGGALPQAPAGGARRRPGARRARAARSPKATT